MFLYTICPACQAGYDLPDLMGGKKLRCKSCASPFSVVAAPRPSHLPALQPFAAIESAAVVTALPTAAIISQGEPSDSLTYLNKPQVKLDRPLVRTDAPAYGPPARSGGGWWGKGGGGAGIGIIILVSVLLRGCAALSRNNSPAPVRTNPPVQWQQPPPPEFKFDPPRGNQGPNNPNNPGGRPANGGGRDR